MNRGDLNAAANIGLRALLDRDWSGAWTWIPALLGEDGRALPNEEKLKGSSLAERWELRDADGMTAASKSKGRNGRKPKGGRINVNAWRAPVDAPLTGPGWKFTSAYRKDVEDRVVKRLAEEAGIDLESAARVVPSLDDSEVVA